MKIGILGGTFDPVHIGHLIIAEGVRVDLGLNQILFVPAGQPWLKQDYAITPAVHRVKMVRMAIVTNPYFKISDIEIEHPGPSYTVDTMAELREQLGTEVDLFFILGYDALAELAKWKEPNKLIQLCKLVAIPRLNSDLPNLKSLEQSIPGVSERVIYCPTPIIDISSSQIRERVARGLSIRYLVPDKIEKYIVKQRLYRR
jgi:nicotinate-nucleotide adenylyltransferase